jgi:hypothetical protein
MLTNSIGHIDQGRRVALKTALVAPPLVAPTWLRSCPTSAFDQMLKSTTAYLDLTKKSKAGDGP